MSNLADPFPTALPTTAGAEFEAFYALPEIRDWTRKFQTRRFGTLALLPLLAIAGAVGIFALMDSIGFELWPGPEWRTEFGIVMLCVAGTLVFLAVFAVLEGRKVAFKLPVLAMLARQRGLTYAAEGSEDLIGQHYVFMLFGLRRMAIQTYTDVFHGHYPDGADFAFFKAYMQQGVDERAYTALDGTIHACDRAGPEAQTVIRSPGGWADYPRPNGPLPRVTIEGDPEVDRMFEVLASDPEEARRLLTRSALGRFLIDQQRKGRVDAYIGPHAAILGIGGRNRFEVGSLLGWRGARARLRRMHDSVVESQEVLRRFREAAG